MVSGTFKSSPSHEGAVRKFAAPAQAMFKQNSRTETILESCISSISEAEIRQNPAATAANFRLRTQANLPHPDLGSNRHGESTMFDRPRHELNCNGFRP
jgi:hypothetical protein